MKKVLMGSIALGLAVASQAVLIDDFESGDLSGYTSTVILDNNGGASNTSSWQSPSGTLQLNTSAYDGIEQLAMIRNGLSLAVGEELQIDVVHNLASQDIGLYVGGTTPVTGTRYNYVNVYYRADGQVFTAGNDGTDNYGTVGWVTPSFSSSLQLFIARTATSDYETGYYADGARSVLTTRTGATLNDADSVGLYADVRGGGTLGDIDNLTVIPEPATIGLVGVFGAGVLFIRRRFSV